jgi:flagellar hook assembly protein FlgD
MRESGNVSIEIYNIKGQKVKTLLNDEVVAGKHIVVWDGRNDNNQTVGSGMFFYRMTTATYTSTKKMIMLK